MRSVGRRICWHVCCNFKHWSRTKTASMRDTMLYCCVMVRMASYPQALKACRFEHERSNSRPLSHFARAWVR